MMKKLIYFVINCLCVYFSEANNTSIYNLINVDTTLYHCVTKCIVTISENELKLKHRPTVVIDAQNLNDLPKNNLIVEEAVYRLLKYKIATVIYDDKKTANNLEDMLKSDDKNKYALSVLTVILLEACEDVSLLNSNKIIEDVKYLIIVIGRSSDGCVEKLKAIRYKVFKHDVTLMFPETVNQNKIATFMPMINETSCEEIVNELTFINMCVNETLKSEDVFPSKHPTDLNKCPIKVGMSTAFPFSEMKNEDELKLETYDSINETVGCDMTLMKTFAKHFNATLELHYLNKRKERFLGINGFIKLLLNGSLDICAGGLYRVYGDIVAYSGVYTRQGIVWVYYAERVERSWENFIGKVNGLYVFVLFYISYSFIWYLIRLFDGDAVSLSNTLLYGWGALIATTSLQDARSLKQKIVNLGYLILSIHLSAYISIQLYSFLTIESPPEILNTNDEIMNSGRATFLLRASKYFVVDKKYNEFANTTTDCFSFVDCIEKTLKYKGVTMAIQGDLYHFQSATAVNGEAKILRAAQNFLTVYNEMLIRKNSPLVKNFRGVMTRLVEAGITQRVFNKAIGTMVMDKANSANSKMMLNSYSCQSGCSITFLQLAGVFYVWVAGCVLSFTIFVVERCMRREKY